MPTIVVFEEDRLLRDAIVAYLGRQGYTVLETTASESVIDCLEHESVQAAILDMHPVAEDVELLKQIRSRAELTYMPIIVILNINSSLEVLDYLEPGAYVRLPFDMPYLDWLLKSLLAKPDGGGHCISASLPAEKKG